MILSKPPAKLPRKSHCLTTRQINELFERFAKSNPNPKTELNYTNEYTLLVAIVLSAQATDTSVNKATKDLFTKVDHPQKMIELGEENLKTYIKTIGLFNSKARHIIALSKKLMLDNDGQIVADIDKLQKLPGVGKKTASVWLNIAHNVPIIAVDTHVQRVSNRIGLVETKLPSQTEVLLNKAIPQKWKLLAHHWLILHGRYICTARLPKCSLCPVNDLCNFYKFSKFN